MAAGADRRGGLAVLALCALLASAGPALAQEVERVTIKLMVSRVSSEPGPIDSAARDLHERLQRDFRYESLRVIQSRELDLALDEVGSLKLPTGRWVRVRPIDVDSRGVLIAVDVERMLQTDLRVPNRHQVVIGAESTPEGKLVISLQPRY